MRDKKTLKVGIVSAGGAGSAHIRYFGAIPGVEVTAVFDPKQENLDRVLSGRQWRLERAFPSWNRYDFFVTTNIDELLDTDLDIVAVCSPDHTHAEYCIQALDAGKHVMCEKPMAPTVRDCVRIMEAIERSQRTFAVMHQMRFIPLYQNAKKVIQRGEIGDVFYVEGDYIHNMRDRGRLYDDWRYRDEESHLPLTGAGCHFVDLFRWLVNDEIVEVSTYGNNIALPEYPQADCMVSLLKSSKGIIGKVLSSFGAALPHTHYLRVFGSEGTIIDNYLYNRDGVRVIHKPLVTQQMNVPRNYALPLRLITRAMRSVLGIRERALLELGEAGRKLLGITPHAFPIDTHEHVLACVHSARDFVKAIQTGQPSLVNAREATLTVAACEAGTVSFLQDRPVKLEEVMRDASLAPVSIQQDGR